MKNKNIYFIILILSISLFSLCFYKLEPDYLWHIKVGEYMFHNGLLTHDIFSWSVNGSYWFSHEWLFEILIYCLKLLFGNYHIFIYCFSSIFFILLLLYLSNKKDYYKNIPFSLLWIYLFIIISFQVQARPHLISYLLFTVMMILLMDNYKNEDSNKIYFLPLLGVLWSNIHGGSSNLIYIVPLLFVIGNLFNFKYAKIESKKISIKQIKKYIIVSILSLISLSINIHGFKMIIYPYINIINNLMINNISEWMSTSLANPSHYFYFILLFVIVITLLFSKKKITFYHLLLFGFFLFLGLKSIRFWFYTYIIASFFIFDYVKERREDKGTNIGMIIISLFLCLMFIAKNNIFNVNYSYLLNKEDIGIIKKESPKKIFNMYDYGGDLIYNDIPVFIDGRADLYSNYNYSDYLEISNLKSKSLGYIEKYNFDYLLVDRKYPLNSFLISSSNYELIYSREDVYFYKKKNYN